MQKELSYRDLLERMQIVIEHSNELFYLHDTNHILTYVSPTSKKILGYNSEEMMMNWTSFSTDNPLNQKGFEITELAIRTGERQPPYLVEIRKQNGSPALLEVDESPIKDKTGRVVAIVGALRDVTEKIRAEDALRAERDKARLYLDISSVMFIALDKNGSIKLVNKKGCQVLGHAREEIIGKNWFDFCIPERFRKDTRAIFSQMMSGIVTPFEYFENPILSADGKERTIAWHNTHIYNKDGSITGTLSSGEDITERKHAEKALQESEERFRDMAELLPEIIFEIDAQGKLTFVNQSAFTQFQYTEAEFINGLNALEMIVPEDRERGLSNIMKILGGKPVGQKEYRAIRKDGSTFPALFHSAAVIRDGKPAGLRGVIIDISARKKMEEALQESEANYRQLFNHAPAGIYEFDMRERRFLSVNDVMCEYTGYSEAEFLKLDVIDMLSEDSLLTLEKLLEKAAAGDSNPDPVEYRIKGKNQREFWVLVHSRFSYDTHGEPWKVTGVAHDVTERRQTEEENKRLEKKLMQAQKMEALGTLSGGIAHDFNNLMTGILGNTSLMLFDLDENHMHYDRLKQIEQLVKRGARLTRQLLGLSRQGKFQALPINLNNLVRESVDIYGRTKKDIQIHTKLQENVWTVVVDRGQIEQVLLNLFINAWQAMPQGGNLYVETNNCFLERAETRAQNLPTGQYVKIAVTDTGIGMDNDTLQKVFDPFFTTKKMERGTGLGLASVYGIIQNHDGMINVHSEPGRGSTFTFYLPASEKESVEQQEPAPAIIPGRGTILLVDDEKMVAETAKKMLEKLGYRVTTAASGKEALSTYASQPDGFDMVILDMIMPIMGGPQTFELLKQINTHVKVLLSSGYSINEQVKNLLSLGCNGFIQKPFTVHELSQKVDSILA
jgi:PAS domain S-box-containing protein